jgi:penicillin-binding protein 2
MSSTKYAELNAPQAHYPLFNRVIDGLYPAGSTFKPFVAAAALSAGLITPETTFQCEGKFIASQQKWDCWDTGGHGTLDLVNAIAQSCDVYFYNLGEQLYHQVGPVLQDSVRKFGFESLTGIDLPGETKGRVPDKYWKEKVGKTAMDRTWMTGDEINLAIGQGDLLVTPLQMAVAVSAIANGGDLWVPHLGLRIEGASGNIIHQFEDEKRGTLGAAITPEMLNTIKTGMIKVTEEHGTAYDAFKGFPIKVAGKTGTAEKLPEDDYALFMGFAPADAPEIAVVAIVEQGGHGSSIAAPVVRRVMEAYFHTQSTTPSQVQTTE